MTGPIWIYLVFILLLLSSCSVSRMTFTPGIVHQYRLQDEDLRGLLFYTGNTITIRKEVDGNFRPLSSTSKLIHRKGKTYEVITIRKGTPGVLSIKQGDSLLISFSNRKNILFIPDRMERIYTTAARPDNGSLLIGDQWYTCSRELQLAIAHDTYEKFSSPRFMAMER